MNLYQYAYNNPYSYYDPNGEFVFALALPFAYILGPAISKACVDAVIVGVVSWGVYESAKYAADYMGSRYTLSEAFCYDLVNNAADNRYDSTKIDRNKKEEREKKYPGGPKDLFLYSMFFCWHVSLNRLVKSSTRQNNSIIFNSSICRPFWIVFCCRETKILIQKSFFFKRLADSLN